VKLWPRRCLIRPTRSICQPSTARTEVTCADSTKVLVQNQQRNLAGQFFPVGILKIEGISREGSPRAILLVFVGQETGVRRQESGKAWCSGCPSRTTDYGLRKNAKSFTFHTYAIFGANSFVFHTYTVS
jgi:hypothetical protein